jgi:hypothetical protein
MSQKTKSEAMTIDITAYKDSYECHKCKFFASADELLVVAKYWEDSAKESNGKPLEGFGSYTFSKFANLSHKAIVEAMAAKYGSTTATTGIVLLGVPELVMRFKILPNSEPEDDCKDQQSQLKATQ